MKNKDYKGGKKRQEQLHLPRESEHGPSTRAAHRKCVPSLFCWKSCANNGVNDTELIPKIVGIAVTKAFYLSKSGFFKVDTSCAITFVAVIRRIYLYIYTVPVKSMDSLFFVF